MKVDSSTNHQSVCLLAQLKRMTLSLPVTVNVGLLSIFTYYFRLFLLYVLSSPLFSNRLIYNLLLSGNYNSTLLHCHCFSRGLFYSLSVCLILSKFGAGMILGILLDLTVAQNGLGTMDIFWSKVSSDRQLDQFR